MHFPLTLCARSQQEKVSAYSRLAQRMHSDMLYDEEVTARASEARADSLLAGGPVDVPLTNTQFNNATLPPPAMSLPRTL